MDRAIMVVILSLAVVASVVIALVRFGDAPPEPGDEWDYDAIGWNLSQGRGFAVGEVDPAFAAPYLASDDEDVRERLDDRREVALTAYRPPVTPYLLAGTYRVFGRHYWPWRVLSGLTLGLVSAGTGWLAWRVAGGPAGILAACLLACNPLVTRFSGKLLTEPFVMLAVLLLAWALVRLCRTGTSARAWRWVVLVGLAAGFSVLTRSLFVLWLPGVVVAAGVARGLGGTGSAGRSAPSATPQERLRRGFLATVVCATVAIVVCLPWWTRNVLVLDAMMPLGTQGGIGLPGGYSDAAVANGGAWVSAESIGIFDGLEAQWRADGRATEGLAWEKAKAKEGQAAALAWMREHWTALPGLAIAKATTMWTSTLGLAGLAMAVCGLGTLPRGGWRRPWVWVLWGLVLINTLSVMATYATGGGRFLLPVYPMLAILGAAGLMRWLTPNLEEHQRPTG